MKPFTSCTGYDLRRADLGGGASGVAAQRPVTSNSKPWNGHTRLPLRTTPPVCGPRCEPRCGQNASATHTAPVRSRQATISCPIQSF